MAALTACQCEHVAHFTDKLTPHGNPGHNYGIKFALSYLRSVKTSHGTFIVCRDCATDCHMPQEATVK